MNFRRKLSILLSCFITCSAASSINNVKAMDSVNTLVSVAICGFSLYNLHNAGWDQRAVECISSCCKKKQQGGQSREISQELDESEKNDTEQLPKEKQD